MRDEAGTPTAAIVDYVEGIRVQLVENGGRDQVKTIETLSNNLEKQATRAAACIEALLLWVKIHLPAEDLLQRYLHDRLQATSRAGQDSSNRQMDHAIAFVTLNWTKEIVDTYQFFKAGRPYAILLRKVAETFPSWDQAVERINAAMLVRQSEHILYGKKPRIGDHGGRAALKGGRSPIANTDLEYVLECAGKGVVRVGERNIQDNDSDVPTELAEEINTWISLERLPPTLKAHAANSNCSHKLCHSLERDPNRLIVPKKSRKRPSAESATKRASSRKKKRPDMSKSHGTDESDDDSEDLQRSTQRHGLLQKEATARNTPQLQSTQRSFEHPRNGEAADGTGAASGPVDDGLAPTSDMRSHPFSLGTIGALRTSPAPNLAERAVQPANGAAGDDAAATSTPPPAPRSVGHTVQPPNRGAGDAPGAGIQSLQLPAAVIGALQTPPRSVEGPQSPPGRPRFVGGKGKTPGLRPPQTRSPLFMDLLDSPPHTEVDSGETSQSFPDFDSGTQPGFFGSDAWDDTEPLPYAFGEDEFTHTVAPEFSPTPVFNNAEDRERQLFSSSPEPDPDEQLSKSTALDVHRSRKERQLATARQRIAQMASPSRLKLAAWGKSTRVARLREGLSDPDNGDDSEHDVDHVTFEALSRHAAATVTKPTIVTGPFVAASRHQPGLSADARDFTGAQIQMSGDTWLRSLRDSQLCMLWPAPVGAGAGSLARTDPEGPSCAIILDPDDILWMPRNMSYAAVTTATGTMQAGKVWGSSTPGSIVEPLSDTPTARQLLEIVKVVLDIPSQLV